MQSSYSQQSYNQLEQAIEGEKEMKYCILFCKIVDVSVDCEGNIYLILSKETKANASLDILRKFWKNKEVSILISELIRARRSDEVGRSIHYAEQRNRETSEKEQESCSQSA
jgi:hypothetical protein